VINGTFREELITAYDHMIQLLPRAFELGSGREAIIVQLLLMQVPGVRQLTVEKLYRAGLHQFNAFLCADPAELAVVSGIEVELAEHIVHHFRNYKENVAAVLAEPVPVQERNRVTQLVQQLRDQHEQFEKASAAWSPEAKADKRRLRRERLQTLSEIYVALARLGEVELVGQLKKMDVKRQLEEVERHLQESAALGPAF
jgi:hypothetical protein